MRQLLLLGILVFTFHVNFASTLPTYKIKNTPNWKTPISLKTNNIGFEDQGSMSYLLLDWQSNEITREYNYRYCIRLNNEDGVQNNSQLYFTFDPSYQELFINKILIHRNGEIVNKLDRNRIEVMRNEKQTDRFLYDGSYSAVAIMEDVRVGDILEYEYTLKGTNPIFESCMYSYISQAYSSEIAHLYREIIVADKNDLLIKNNFGGISPKINHSTRGDHLVWDLKNIQPIFTDDDTPSWYNAYALTEISSFKNWSEVRKFTKELYPLNINCAGIDQYIKKNKLKETESGIMEIIRFVQNDIRYLGIEIGANSHEPHHPQEVFTQRFGDCKDKSYLLTIMLKRIGVNAWPALVNTRHKKAVDQYAPSPFAFNHVIVKFNWKEKEYWVDPTSNLEKGGLSELQNPMYGKALVLDSNSNDLAEIPENQIKKAIIVEDFWYTDSISKVKYTVESTFLGELANNKRSQNISSSMAINRESYLEYCTKFYDDLKWQNDSSLTFVDEEGDNVFITKEEYWAENLWEHREKDSIEFYTSCYPYNLYEFLNSTDDKVRSMPLAIAYPVDIELKINMHFPEHKELGFTLAKDSIVNDIFRFSYETSVDSKNHMATVIYKYKTFKDHVPVNQLDLYFKDYDLLSDNCEYPMEWGVDVKSEFEFFQPALFISFLFLVFIFFVFRKLYYWDKKSELEFKGGNQPIGGWLVLVAIGLYLTPFTVSYLIYNLEYFNLSSWTNYISSHEEFPFLAGSLYFFEIILNIGIILFAIFLIVLMHQKRNSFPMLFVWFRIVVLAGLIIDTIIVAKLVGLDISDYSDLFKTILGAAIWVPYMLYSQRVKNTFVKPHSRKIFSNKKESENIGEESYA